MESFKIMDGAMGSELIQRGFPLPKHIWSSFSNINNPEMVELIHRNYIDAGSEYITTNTFRTTPRAYRKTGLTEKESIEKARFSLINAVSVAQKTINNDVKILGSIAPLEDCYLPNLFPGQKIAINEFKQLGEWLVLAGVDILLLETMNSISETESALIGIKNLDVPVWVSFIMKDKNFLLSGDSIKDALKMLHDYYIDCVLFNCNPLHITLMTVENIVDNDHFNWGVCPNLGVGEPSSDGCINHYEKMQDFISVMKKIISLGPFVIGACCGSSPKHIAELNKLRNKSRSSSN